MNSPMHYHLFLFFQNLWRWCQVNKIKWKYKSHFHLCHHLCASRSISLLVRIEFIKKTYETCKFCLRFWMKVAWSWLLVIYKSHQFIVFWKLWRMMKKRCLQSVVNVECHWMSFSLNHFKVIICNIDCKLLVSFIFDEKKNCDVEC